MSTYPFKFLDAYNSGDTGIFFGRDEEITALYEMVFQSPILLVYGASGTGKTSLIQCGLAGKFQVHDWLALTIRRGTDINDSFQKALAGAGGNTGSGEDMDWLNKLMNEDDDQAQAKPLSPLARSLKAVYQASFRPLYLIFDQFEELFILGTKPEQLQFIETVKEILAAEQPVKMIFSIREEYLGHLSDFEKAVPQLLRKKLRVEAMNLDKVRQVILGSTASKGSNVQLKEGEAGEIADLIFDKIKGDANSLTIELPYLQVFLDKLYLGITHDETRTKPAVFSTEALNRTGNIGDVLSDFMDDQVTAISKMTGIQDTQKSTEAVWKMLSLFVTLEGTKKPITKEQLVTGFPDLDEKKTSSILTAFMNGRIIRKVADSGTYEIAHDSLAKRIAEKRTDEEIAILKVINLIRDYGSLEKNAGDLFSEKQLIFIDQYLEKIQLSEAEKLFIKESRAKIENEKNKERDEQQKQIKDEINKKNRNRRNGFITVAAIVMGLLACYAFWQRNSAVTEKNNAIRQKNIADTAKNNAKAVRDSVIIEKNNIDSLYKDVNRTLNNINSIIQTLPPETQHKFSEVTLQLELNVESNINKNHPDSTQKYTIDVYYLESADEKLTAEAYAVAQKVVTSLKQKYPGYPVNLKKLPYKTNAANAGFKIGLNLIQCEKSELGFASEVLNFIKEKKLFKLEQPVIQKVYFPTPRYISIFVRNM